jgi:hypothetical protein
MHTTPALQISNQFMGHTFKIIIEDIPFALIIDINNPFNTHGRQVGIAIYRR